MDMPTAINKVSFLHVTYDNIEEHLKSLNVLGDDTIQRQIMLIIQLNFPKIVLLWLEEKRNGDRN